MRDYNIVISVKLPGDPDAFRLYHELHETVTQVVRSAGELTRIELQKPDTMLSSTELRSLSPIGHEEFT